MTYEWRLNIAPSNSWWSLEEVAEPTSPPDALREFKLRVMGALDHETRLELRAHKLRQELHAELDGPFFAHSGDPSCTCLVHREYDDDPTAC